MQLAITGTGAISPLGLSAPELCEALLAGKVGIRLAPWASPDNPDLYGGVDDRFDPLAWADERVVAGSDGFAHFALAAAAQALAEAGLDGEGALHETRTAIVHGTSMGGLNALMRAQRAYEHGGPSAVDPKTMIQIWPNMAAAQLAMRYKLHGPSLTVTTACASSLDALGTAAALLNSGQADVALVGATEGGYVREADDVAWVPATAAAGTGYGMQTASPDPRRAMLPFDRNRAGIVSGEGSCWFVLETAEHAARRGVAALAWLRGYGSLADGHHPSSPEPNGRWEARAIELAQADAGIGPGDVDVLVAHATGTPKGDQAEIRALNGVFGGTELTVTGLKGNTGHTGASAGAMNVLAGVWAMHHGRVPAVAGTRELDPEVDFDVVVGEPRSLDVGVLQVNAFGFGGQNASIVVTRDA